MHRRPRDRSRSAVRFALVGVVNTVIDLGLFAVLHSRLGILGANLCSTSAGMAFSYVANGRYTFRVRRHTARGVGLFVLGTGTTMWVVQPLLIEWFSRAAGAPVLTAKLAGLSVSVVLNYLLSRRLVWPESDVRSGPRRAGRDAARAEARR